MNVVRTSVAVALAVLAMAPSVANAKVCAWGNLDAIGVVFAIERVPTFPVMVGNRGPRIKINKHKHHGPVTFDSTLPLPITDPR